MEKDNNPEKYNKTRVGRFGEDIAAKFLESRDIEIIKRNYFTKFGEIDLIGIENKTIIFIEVKLRFDCSFGAPFESIDQRKWEKLQKSAEMFLIENNFSDKECRFDMLSLLYSDVYKSFKVEWLKNQIFY
ncbi:MAG: YraN family protein [Spirochaetes bacterium]|nr:YraN family protein [Spirochaetota bacterium]